MISILNGLPSLAKSDEAGGWVGRIAKQLDIVRDILASLEVGQGLNITADATGRIRITLDEIVAGTGTAAAENSAFVATAIEVEDSSSGSGSGSGNAKCEVKVLGGTVQGIFGEIAVFPTLYFIPSGNEPSEFGDYDADAGDEIVHANVKDGDIFWLEFDPVKQEWNMQHGEEEDMPTDASVSAEDTVRYFAVIPLFRVRLSEPTHGVVQYHFGSVYVPTATNVVDVQTLDEEASSSGNESA